MATLFLAGTSHLYAGAILAEDHNFILDGRNISDTLYITGSMGGDAGFGPVLERYWLVSTGVAIYAPSNYPLYFNYTETTDGDGSLLNRQFCLKTDSVDNLPLKSSSKGQSMDYAICVGDLNTVHDFSINQPLSNQSSTTLQRPSTDLLQNPVWSVHVNKISQQEILDYAAGIFNGNFSHSHIIISNWEQYLGDLDFDPERFPDPTAMFGKLKTLGFSPILSVTPYVSIMSRKFQEAVNGGYLVLDASGEVPGLVKVQLGRILHTTFAIFGRLIYYH